MDNNPSGLLGGRQLIPNNPNTTDDSYGLINDLARQYGRFIADKLDKEVEELLQLKGILSHSKTLKDLKPEDLAKQGYMLTQDEVDGVKEIRLLKVVGSRKVKFNLNIQTEAVDKDTPINLDDIPF